MRLSFRRLGALANAVAQAHGLSMPSSRRLLVRYNDKEPIPTVTVAAPSTTLSAVCVKPDLLSPSAADKGPTKPTKAKKMTIDDDKFTLFPLIGDKAIVSKQQVEQNMFR